MLIAEAFARFQEDIRPAVVATYGENDAPAMSEAWNDYTDELTRDRNGLNATQYHYCPAVDDSMPGDDMDSELEFLLEAMNVKFTVKQVDARPDSMMNDMPAGSRHYRVTVSRGSRATFYYSQGPAITHAPDPLDVLEALFMDATEEDFEDWCKDYGYSDDSRRAEKTYKACVRTRKKLEKLFDQQEREDLADMLNDR